MKITFGFLLTVWELIFLYEEVAAQFAVTSELQPAAASETGTASQDSSRNTSITAVVSANSEGVHHGDSGGRSNTSALEETVMEGGPQHGENFKQILATTSASPSRLRLNMTKDGNTEALRVSRCQQPPVTGMCRAMYYMWYYDSANTTCRSFIYGGCGGNDNNFQSEEHCRAACPDEVICPEDPSRICLVSESACINATCPNEPDAICRVTPCTCRTVFVNETGHSMQCKEPTTTSASTPATTPDDINDISGEQDDKADEAWMVYIWVAIGVFLLLVVVMVVWMLVHYCSKQSNSFYTTYTASSPMKKSESPSCLLSPELYTPGKFTEFSSLHV